MAPRTGVVLGWCVSRGPLTPEYMSCISVTLAHVCCSKTLVPSAAASLMRMALSATFWPPRLCATSESVFFFKSWEKRSPNAPSFTLRSMSKLHPVSGARAACQLFAARGSRMRLPQLPRDLSHEFCMLAGQDHGPWTQQRFSKPAFWIQNGRRHKSAPLRRFLMTL